MFQRASDYLSPHLSNTDSLLHMYSYWARLELNLGKDLIAARGVWESLLKIRSPHFTYVLVGAFIYLYLLRRVIDFICYFYPVALCWKLGKDI